MSQLYVYDNELLGDDGTQFNDTSCVDCINRSTEEECLAEFNAAYDSNSFTSSFTKHQ